MGRILEAFEAQLDQQLDRLPARAEGGRLSASTGATTPIQKRDKPGEYRMLGIPTIYDRVCQQALLNRLEPIFEPVFDDASFGYRRGRSTKDANAQNLEGDTKRVGVDSWMRISEIFSDPWITRNSSRW